MDTLKIIQEQTLTNSTLTSVEEHATSSDSSDSPECRSGSDSEEQYSGLRCRTAQAAADTKVAPALRQAVRKSSLRARSHTFMALLCLWTSAPFLILWALFAWLRFKLFGGAYEKGATAEKKQLRILVTGGKMSKASAVARAVGRDGHIVFTAEVLPYKFCHTRYCSYVSKHYVLPRPVSQPTEWEAAIQAIVKEQEIDLLIPCTAPVESSAYAHLQERLPSSVRVFAFDGTTCDELDNKYTFNQMLERAGLPCPETANMECLEDAVKFFKKREGEKDDGKRFIVKPAVYDPKARTEILFLPIEDQQRQMEYLRSRNASKAVPYVIQEVLAEPELGCCAWFNKGVLTGFEFFASAASCLVYRQLKNQYEHVLELNRGIGKAMNLTGQFTLDLMHKPSGELVPIECNPRIHSAVCTLEGHKNLGAVFSDPNFLPSEEEVVKSKPETYRYWVMDQVFLMLGFWKPNNCFKLNILQMLTGSDALLHGDDPLPFLGMYLVQIPSLLVLEFLTGTEWLKIDFCIGKIVKDGGD